MEKRGKRARDRIAERSEAEHNTSGRKEVERFMEVFAKRLEALNSSVETFDLKGGDIQFKDFLDFQNLTSELLTFLIIIEKRLQTLNRESKDKLIARLDDLVIAIWSILLKGALSFFVVMAEDQYLPLGSREVFMRELRTLDEAQAKLSASPYKEKVSDEIKQRLEKAERILLEVIEKAPSLLEL